MNKNISNLQQENTQLKEENEKGINAILELIGEIVDLKSVLKEIREYIKNNDDFYYGDELYEQYEKILEIIDKGSDTNE